MNSTHGIVPMILPYEEGALNTGIYAKKIVIPHHIWLTSVHASVNIESCDSTCILIPHVYSLTLLCDIRNRKS